MRIDNTEAIKQVTINIHNFVPVFFLNIGRSQDVKFLNAFHKKKRDAQAHRHRDSQKTCTLTVTVSQAAQ